MKTMDCFSHAKDITTGRNELAVQEERNLVSYKELYWNELSKKLLKLTWEGEFQNEMTTHLPESVFISFLIRNKGNEPGNFSVTLKAL